MAVLIILFGSWIALRAAGAIGIQELNGWSSSAPYALSLMFAFTALAHFNKMKHELAGMVPRVFPRPLLIIYITGVLEFFGAVGLLILRIRVAAAICLIVLLIAMFPANVKAARERLTLRGRPATGLWLRLPMQILFLGLLWWSCARLP